MNTMLSIVICIAAVLLIAAVVITYLIMHARQVKACNVLENEIIRSQEALKNAQALRETDRQAFEKAEELLKESFREQLEAVKAQMSAETEKLLKQREEALNAKAEETFRTLMGPLDKDLKAMQESFEVQKRTHTEGTATLKTAVE